MNGALEVTRVTQGPIDNDDVEDLLDVRDFIELEAEIDCEIRELAWRCRVLLAQRPGTDQPPGHWLG